MRTPRDWIRILRRVLTPNGGESDRAADTSAAPVTESHNTTSEGGHPGLSSNGETAAQLFSSVIQRQPQYANQDQGAPAAEHHEKVREEDSAGLPPNGETAAQLLPGPIKEEPPLDINEDQLERFLRGKILESQDNQFSSTMGMFAEYPSCFTMSDVACWLESDTDRDAITRALTAEQGFIRLGKGDSGEEFFISEGVLFQWWGRLTARLARAGRAELSRHGLVTAMNSLRQDGRWDLPPQEAVAFGKRFGFVHDRGESQNYSFPMASCLSYLSPARARQAEIILPGLFNAAKQGNVSGRESLVANGSMTTGEGCSVLDTLTRREQRVLTLRFGLDGGRARTLEGVGKEYGVGRERIRQIEAKALKKLCHHARAWKLVSEFLYGLLARQGSLIVDVNWPDAPYRLFLAKCLQIPRLELPEFELVVLGVSQDKTADRGSARYWSELVERDAIAAVAESQYGRCLGDSDLAMMVEIAVQHNMRRSGNKAQKVRMVMQQIGKPAHYSEINEVYNSLFPDQPSSENNIHAILSREPLDIVWIGVQGTFGLKTWGYERPSGSLFDQVAEIVESRFKETGRPVPFEIIAAEMGKKRKVVVPSSLTIAAHFNPRLERVHGTSFIPRPATEQDENDVSAEELDRVLREFEKQRGGAGDTASDNQTPMKQIADLTLQAAPSESQSLDVE